MEEQGLNESLSSAQEPEYEETDVSTPSSRRQKQGSTSCR